MHKSFRSRDNQVQPQCIASICKYSSTGWFRCGGEDIWVIILIFVGLSWIYKLEDATQSFQKHEKSKTHIEAVGVVIRKIIFSSVRFLAWQGLALRGEGSDENPNLIQLLWLRAEEKPQILKWLEKSSRKQKAHENQNEMLQIMSHTVIRNILDDIKSHHFFRSWLTKLLISPT